MQIGPGRPGLRRDRRGFGKGAHKEIPFQPPFRDTSLGVCARLAYADSDGRAARGTPRSPQDATNEKTKAGAIDVAVMHYLADLRAKRDAAPELSDDLAELLSTPCLPIERETRIGRTE